MKCVPSRGEGSQNALRSDSPAQLHHHNFFFNFFFDKMKNGFFVSEAKHCAMPLILTPLNKPQPGESAFRRACRLIVRGNLT